MLSNILHYPAFFFITCVICLFIRLGGCVIKSRGRGGGGGRGTPIYGLYKYVPRDRVWVLRFSVLK